MFHFVEFGKHPVKTLKSLGLEGGPLRVPFPGFLTGNQVTVTRLALTKARMGMELSEAAVKVNLVAPLRRRVPCCISHSECVLPGHLSVLDTELGPRRRVSALQA